MGSHTPGGDSGAGALVLAAPACAAVAPPAAGSDAIVISTIAKPSSSTGSVMVI